MPSSKLQRHCSRALSDYFGGFDIYENTRPEWCLNDNYERLELDFYIPALNAAIEVQGAQHYEFTARFHRSVEDFKAQQKRDQIKRQRCLDYGITLIEVYDQTSIENAIRQLRNIKNSMDAQPKKRVTALEWRVRVTNLNHDVIHLWQSRNKGQLPWNKYTGKVNSRKSKLLMWTNVYGMGIFRYVDETIAQSLFYHMQKLDYWLRDIYKSQRNPSNSYLQAISKQHTRRESAKRAALASAAADTNESEA